MASKAITISRRFVLKAGLAVGGGLLLDVYVPASGAVPRRQTTDAAFAPNAFVRVDKTGAVTLIMRDTEVRAGDLSPRSPC